MVPLAQATAPLSLPETVAFRKCLWMVISGGLLQLSPDLGRNRGTLPWAWKKNLENPSKIQFTDDN